MAGVPSGVRADGARSAMCMRLYEPTISLRDQLGIAENSRMWPYCSILTEILSCALAATSSYKTYDDPNSLGTILLWNKLCLLLTFIAFKLLSADRLRDCLVCRTRFPCTNKIVSAYNTRIPYSVNPTCRLVKIPAADCAGVRGSSGWLCYIDLFVLYSAWSKRSEHVALSCILFFLFFSWKREIRTFSSFPFFPVLLVHSSTTHSPILRKLCPYKEPLDSFHRYPLEFMPYREKGHYWLKHKACMYHLGLPTAVLTMLSKTFGLVQEADVDIVIWSLLVLKCVRKCRQLMQMFYNNWCLDVLGLHRVGHTRALFC